MIHLKIKTEENTFVHLPGPLEAQCYTLCGLDTMGDSFLNIGEPVEVKTRVDCPDCIRYVKFCKSVSDSEMVKK